MQSVIFIFLVFIALWGAQFILTHYQLKNYYKTIAEMSRRDSGYLGVGVSKKRFGKGVVIILVSDNEDNVIDAKIMSGVTVFTRFEKYSELIGEKIATLKESHHRFNEQTYKALNDAIKKIDNEKYQV